MSFKLENIFLRDPKTVLKSYFENPKYAVRNIGHTKSFHWFNLKLENIIFIFYAIRKSHHPANWVAARSGFFLSTLSRIRVDR